MKSIIVAVIDTGIFSGHNDLRANMWADPDIKHRNIRGYNALSTYKELRNSPRDKYGHGTHVAGIIRAVTNNRKGIAGIARMPGIVKLMACKAFNGGIMLCDKAIQCIEYAYEHSARILNCSWRTRSYNEYKLNTPNQIQSLKDIFLEADKRGLISVIAAGNDGEDNNTLKTYPACFATDKDPIENMIVVAATGRDGRLWGQDLLAANAERKDNASNYGNKSVHIAAPGAEILSTGHSSNSSYVLMSGTSMAAPHVVGALALMMAKNPFIPSRTDLNREGYNEELREYNAELLEKLCGATNKDILENGYNISNYVQYGRLDLSAALQPDSDADSDIDSSDSDDSSN